MACPCCKSDQLVSVSYCRECGSCYEDHEVIIPGEERKSEVKEKRNTNVERPSNRFKLNPPPSPVLMDQEIKSATDRIHSKETNRTLLEFQSKDGTLPEWRVQLQNAVRQRALGEETDSRPRGLESNGNYSEQPIEPTNTVEDDDDFFDNAEIIEVNRVKTEPNDLLSSALSRIDASREKYFIEEVSDFPRQSIGNTATAVVAEVAPVIEDPIREKTSVNFPVEERVEETAPEIDYDPKVNLYDTSELNPEFVPAKVTSSFGTITPATREEIPEEEEAVQVAAPAQTEEDLVAPETVVYEDVTAPFAFRFNAGLFDLLTTSFASMLLMAPFVLLGGNWMSISGLVGFLTIFTIVSFLYLTTTVGLFGKSFGMHLFSLEMIHSNGEEYPSFNQSAVSSSLYLLSVASLGAGFITCLFDDERRAVHDIVSETIIVREE